MNEEHAALLRMERLLQVLDEAAIAYQRFDHSPVYTVAQANALLSEIPGTPTKNLFLRDRKGRRYFLLVSGDNHPVDLGNLAQLVGVTKLSLASPDRLAKYLQIDPGSVSVLALINDRRLQVELLIERPVWTSTALQAHPLVNTATLVISKSGLEKFLTLTGHTPRILG